LEIYHFATFEEILERFGVALLLPDVRGGIGKAVEIYLNFKGYRQGERLHGAVAFRLQVEAELQQQRDLVPLNDKQKSFRRAVFRNVERAIEYFATADADRGNALRREAIVSKARLLTGPPGTGKTTVAHQLVEDTLANKGKVLFTAPTAQLVSRM
jgi:hypothetical protein